MEAIDDLGLHNRTSTIKVGTNVSKSSNEPQNE